MSHGPFSRSREKNASPQDLHEMQCEKCIPCQAMPQMFLQGSKTKECRKKGYLISVHRPSSGMINVTGSPNNAIGIITGNKNTNNGSL